MTVVRPKLCVFARQTSNIFQSRFEDAAIEAQIVRYAAHIATLLQTNGADEGECIATVEFFTPKARISRRKWTLGGHAKDAGCIVERWKIALAFHGEWSVERARENDSQLRRLLLAICAYAAKSRNSLHPVETQREPLHWKVCRLLFSSVEASFGDERCFAAVCASFFQVNFDIDAEARAPHWKSVVGELITRSICRP